MQTDAPQDTAGRFAFQDTDAAMSCGAADIRGEIGSNLVASGRDHTVQ